MQIGTSVSQKEIDFLRFLNLFEVLVPRVNLDISKVDLKPILKGGVAEDILNKMHSEDDVRESILFNLAKLDYTPILELLHQNGVKFDKTSEGKNLLQFAYENRALSTVNLFLSYDEFFDSSKVKDDDTLN